MSGRDSDRAREFCDLVGAPNLVSHLGLAHNTTAEVAVEALRAARKKMQGMQSNPKYKEQALFLIKNSAALERVLADPAAHIRDGNLRLVEDILRGVLRGGSLTYQQERHLFMDAHSLSVSESDFELMITRVCSDVGIARPAAEEFDPSAPGAPSRRLGSQGRAANLVIVGERVRKLRSRDAVELILRNTGSPPMTGTVVPSAPWLLVSPVRLHPTQPEQRVKIAIDPAAREAGEVDVDIHLDDGVKARVTYVVPSRGRVLSTRALAVFVPVGGVALGFALGMALPPLFQAAPAGLVVYVDPPATELFLAGEAMGGGARVEVAVPRVGLVEVVASRDRYHPATDMIELKAGVPSELRLALTVSEPLAFEPTHEHTMGEISMSSARSALGNYDLAVVRCLDKSVDKVGEGAGSVNIYVDAGGRAVGTVVNGIAADTEAYEICLWNWLASVEMPEVADADYATVRLDYRVFPN